jgi:A/G-specific adenine glycosylase
MDAPDTRALHDAVLDWYDAHARDLPWRGDAATPWSVMVSEFMLQQTPVARVVPVHAAWLERWPAPADLAADTTGEAVRMWGRLGYPRRALRLHAAAVAIVERHDGEVPRSYAELLALPGVGDYTASAVASFAFGQRHVVLDTNVRRVLVRAVSGRELPAPAVTRAERDVATALLPDDEATAATWAVATMELGALVCTARRRATPVRSRRTAGGERRASPRTTDLPAAARRGTAPTGSAAAASWRWLARATRSRRRRSRRRGRPPTSASAAWTDSSPTAS